MKTIRESDMDFIIRKDSKLFHVEKSQTFKSLKGGIRTVEFLYLYPDKGLMLVEAKRSCPNANNIGESEEKKAKYEEFFQELTDKYTHSVSLYASVLLGRRERSEEIGSELTTEKFSKCRLIFLLVLKTAEETWLGPVKTELERRLMPMRKIWRADVVVLNEAMAQEMQIVRA